MKILKSAIFTSLCLGLLRVEAFQPIPSQASPFRFTVADAITSTTMLGTTGGNSESGDAKKTKPKDVMAFLRKKGAVGRNQDFSTAMGVDEGPVGKNRSEGKRKEQHCSLFKERSLEP
jgi:hypothetical protein